MSQWWKNWLEQRLRVSQVRGEDYFCMYTVTLVDAHNGQGQIFNE